MTLVRKLFWPLAAALGLLAFLVAASPSQADYQYGRHTDGDFCAVNGPKVITVGQTYLYAGVMDHWSSHGTTVSVDNIVGQSQITSVVDANDNYTTINPTNQIANAPDFNVLQLGDYGHHYNGTDSNFTAEVNSMHDGHQNISLSSSIIDQLTAQYGSTAANALLTLNSCGISTTDALTRIIEDAILNGTACNPAASSLTTGCSPVGAFPYGINSNGNCILTTGNPAACSNTSGTALFGDWDIDCPDANTCTIATAMITNVASAIAADLANPYKYSSDYKIDCYDIAEDASKAAILAGPPQSVALQVYDFVFQACGAGFELGDLQGFHHDGFIDSLVVVDVTCTQPGNFDISWTDERETDDSISQNVICRGPASSKSTITAVPASVEIVPAVGSVSHSLVTVTLLDASGAQAGTGTQVDFSIDRCSVQSTGVATKATYDTAKTVFGAYNVNSSATAAAIEASPSVTGSYKTSASTIGVDDTNTDGSNANTVAAVVVGCNPTDSVPTATPGVATVTAIIAVAGADVVLTTKINVVGPPFAMTISASPTTVRCGEKATITVSVKDAIGQNVSDHTRVEAVTNIGGVLGGTGAVANDSGPVVPVASTVAETFQGQATFYLLTSDQQTGPYEVVVTTGGAGSLGSALGGVFSTPPVTIQTTVTCNNPNAVAPVAPAAPVAAPTFVAPITGQGPTILPPNTGDAGLAAATHGTSWTVFALIGVVSFAIAGLASVSSRR